MQQKATAYLIDVRRWINLHGFSERLQEPFLEILGGAVFAAELFL